jgi:hypothetical protein
MALYIRTLERTYFEQGFFNVERDFDHLIRPDDGPIMILLGNTGQLIEAQVNRRANLNGTARILGRRSLREWFEENYQVGDSLQIQIISPNQLHIIQPSS